MRRSTHATQLCARTPPHFTDTHLLLGLYLNFTSFHKLGWLFLIARLRGMNRGRGPWERSRVAQTSGKRSCTAQVSFLDNDLQWTVLRRLDFICCPVSSSQQSSTGGCKDEEWNSQNVHVFLTTVTLDVCREDDGDMNTVTETQTPTKHTHSDLLLYPGKSWAESVCVHVRVGCRRSSQTKKLMHNLNCAWVSLWLCFKAGGGFIRRWLQAFFPHCTDPVIFTTCVRHTLFTSCSNPFICPSVCQTCPWRCPLNHTFWPTDKIPRSPPIHSQNPSYPILHLSLSPQHPVFLLQSISCSLRPSRHPSLHLWPYTFLNNNQGAESTRHPSQSQFPPPCCLPLSPLCKTFSDPLAASQNPSIALIQLFLVFCLLHWR